MSPAQLCSRGAHGDTGKGLGLQGPCFCVVGGPGAVT